MSASKRDATAARPALSGYAGSDDPDRGRKRWKLPAPSGFTQGNSLADGVGMNIDNKIRDLRPAASRARGEFEQKGPGPENEETSFAHSMDRRRFPALPKALTAKTDQPEANRIKGRRCKEKVQIHEGNVVLAGWPRWSFCPDKFVVTRTPMASRRASPGLWSGGLARFKQKREGKDEFIEGEGERIEHDARSVKSPSSSSAPGCSAPRRGQGQLHIPRRVCTKNTRSLRGLS